MRLEDSFNMVLEKLLAESAENMSQPIKIICHLALCYTWVRLHFLVQTVRLLQYEGGEG